MNLKRSRHSLGVPDSQVLLACGGRGKRHAPPRRVPLQLCVNGAVDAITTGDDGTVYVGGEFTRVSEYVGAVAAVDTVTGERVTSIPTTDGDILTCLPDGSGGYFIGGTFTQVNGVPRKSLAHILANGTVDPVWKPEVEGYGQDHDPCRRQHLLRRDLPAGQRPHPDQPRHRGRCVRQPGVHGPGAFLQLPGGYAPGIGPPHGRRDPLCGRSVHRRGQHLPGHASDGCCGLRWEQRGAALESLGGWHRRTDAQDRQHHLSSGLIQPYRTG